MGRVAPRAWLWRAPLSDGDFRLLAFLWSLGPTWQREHDQTPTGIRAYPSRETIAQALGKNRSWVDKHVRSLRHKGYIRTHELGGWELAAGLPNPAWVREARRVAKQHTHKREPGEFQLRLVDSPDALEAWWATYAKRRAALRESLGLRTGRMRFTDTRRRALRAQLDKLIADGVAEDFEDAMGVSAQALDLLESECRAQRFVPHRGRDFDRVTTLDPDNFLKEKSFKRTVGRTRKPGDVARTSPVIDLTGFERVARAVASGRATICPSCQDKERCACNNNDLSLKEADQRFSTLPKLSSS